MTTKVYTPGQRGAYTAPPGTTTGELRSGVPAFQLGRSEWVRSLLVFLAAALVLLLADMALLQAHPGSYRVAIGNYRDKFFLDDTNRQEVDTDGTTYRWTRGTSTLWLTEVGQLDGALLTLELGGRPTATDINLTLNDQPWTALRATEEPRTYTLVLPRDLPAQLRVGIHSPTFSASGDGRELGVKVEAFALTLPHGRAPLPTPAQYLAQLVLIAAVQLTVIRLGGRWQGQALLAALAALALALVLSGLLLLTYAYLPRLAIAGLALAGLTWLVLPLAERYLARDEQAALDAPVAGLGEVREVRLLWALTLLACAVRLVGVLYTTFGSQDFGINIDRVIRVISGQMVIIKGSHEFADGLTIYPPGPYLALVPGATLISDLGALMHGFTALLDGTTPFLVALLTRRLGGNRDAARFALVLYAGSISAFGTLAYGFQQQIFGQWFSVPIALLLLAADTPPQPRSWLLATLLLLFGVFSHIGVAILSFSWFGIMGLLMLVAYRGFNRSWWCGAGLLVAGALLAFGLLYIDIYESSIQHASTEVVAQADDSWLPGATELLVKGMRLGYSDAGLLLLPLGLLLIVRFQPDRRRLIVVAAWLLAALLFLCVDLIWAVQVRYFYFALPLVLAAFGIALGYLSSYSRWVRLASWALVLAITLQHTALWLSAAFGDGKISMTPLTH